MFDDVHCKSSFGSIFLNGNKNIVIIHCHSIAYCPLPSSPVNGTLGKEWTTKHFASRTVNRGLSMLLSADLIQWSLLWPLLFGPMNQHVLAVDFLNEWATCVYVAEKLDCAEPGDSHHSLTPQEIPLNFALMTEQTRPLQRHAPLFTNHCHL